MGTHEILATFIIEICLVSYYIFNSLNCNLNCLYLYFHYYYYYYHGVLGFWEQYVTERSTLKQLRIAKAKLAPCATILGGATTPRLSVVDVVVSVLKQLSPRHARWCT